MAKQQYKSLTTVALKVLMLTHKSQLYCPFLELPPLVPLYNSIMRNWININE